jgi:Flp pilus assembly protein TadG
VSPLPLLRRLAADRRGAAAVEMAMVMPALLLLLLGGMEAGRMAWTKATLTYAVQEAARCGAVNATLCPTDGAIQAVAAQRGAVLRVPAASFVVAHPACGVQVSVDVTQGFILYRLAPDAPHITAQVCRR